MRNVLSQNEIDSLLKSLEQGEVSSEELVKDQVKIRKYDFKRPNRFSKSNLNTLAMVHDIFARQAANYLSAYLRATVNVKLATVDQVAFEDVVVSLPGSTLVVVFSIEDYGPALLNVGSELVIPMIDLICGGNGEAIRKLRVVTELELAIYHRLSTHLLGRYEVAWKETTPIKCTLDSIEQNARLIQSISPHEMVAVITLTVNINKVQGILTICLPFTTVNALINRPEVDQTTEAGPSLQQQWHDKQKLLSSAELGLAALLGSCEISVEEFLQLQVGDCLAIDTKLGSPVNLTIEGKSAFLAQPGLLNNQLAVQIISPLTEGEEDYEQ
ncbi:MAG: flagellar motor switch protein FliM [Bacillota bacterium]|nr:MAG: flagellar motor switch protein FliM [Bacillota bacterium]MBS3951241.1 flagellar motor switch protein FliM [Peptococcaceae bacterium]